MWWWSSFHMNGGTKNTETFSLSIGACLSDWGGSLDQMIQIIHEEHSWKLDETRLHPNKSTWKNQVWKKSIENSSVTSLGQNSIHSVKNGSTRPRPVKTRSQHGNWVLYKIYKISSFFFPFFFFVNTLILNFDIMSGRLSQVFELSQLDELLSQVMFLRFQTMIKHLQ